MSVSPLKSVELWQISTGEDLNLKLLFYFVHTGPFQSITTDSSGRVQHCLQILNLHESSTSFKKEENKLVLIPTCYKQNGILRVPQGLYTSCLFCFATLLSTRPFPLMQRKVEISLMTNAAHLKVNSHLLQFHYRPSSIFPSSAVRRHLVICRHFLC